jgi:hypothetical protein
VNLNILGRGSEVAGNVGLTITLTAEPSSRKAVSSKDSQVFIIYILSNLK